jgi:hypothetical protein
MDRSQEYRRFAEECLKMAGATENEHTRAIFTHMAQVWFRLAEEKENDNDAPKDETS